MNLSFDSAIPKYITKEWKKKCLNSCLKWQKLKTIKLSNWGLVKKNSINNEIQCKH